MGHVFLIACATAALLCLDYVAGIGILSLIGYLVEQRNLLGTLFSYGFRERNSHVFRNWRHPRWLGGRIEDVWFAWDGTRYAAENVPSEKLDALRQQGYVQVELMTVLGPTKTGLRPDDLQTCAGMPLAYQGKPAVPMTDSQKITAIRWAEDWVEQETGLLLTTSWIASPPTRTSFETTSAGMATASGMQQLGVDYDIEDAPYDFHYDRAQDDGWMVMPLRYRPVRKITGHDFSPLKNLSFQYPMLNNYFRVPPSWFVVDGDFGLVRLVPSANMQMLPLFAFQFTFGGYTGSLPGALWLRYTAGLTNSDYATRFAFIKRLVLVKAGTYALRSIAGGISMGADSYDTLIDGIQYRVKYGAKGPFGAQIEQFETEAGELLQSKVAGPQVLTFCKHLLRRDLV